MSKMLMVLSIFLFSTLTQAEVVSACKKRNPLVYQSFSWAVISKSDEGSFLFQYGVGLSDEMTEIYFQSPIEKTADKQYSFQDSNYSLSVKELKNKLSFTVQTAQQTVKKTGYDCK